MRDIYLLSGLGAGKSVFNFIDLSGFNANHIEWVNPAENEQIENYAKRLSKQHIHGTDDKIFPLKAADYKVYNGGHLMVINKGEELTALIRKILS